MSVKPKDHLLAAIAFASINGAMMGGMSLSAKLLSEYFDPIEVTFWRNSMSLLLLLVWLFALGNFTFYKTKRPYAHLFRSAIGTVGITLGMWTVSILSLAETTILLFTSPLFTVLLSGPILGERVGIYRYGAVLVGFIGVAIVAGPVGSEALPIIGIIAGLGWGFTSGAVDVILRWIGSTEKSQTTTFYFLLFGVITCGLYWPFSATPITGIATDNLPLVAGIIALLGLTGGIGLLAKTHSYRLGEASLIAPIMYTMLIWSVLFDYLFWDRIPNWNVFVGATIIITANLFILRREHIKNTALKNLERQNDA